MEQQCRQVECKTEQSSPAVHCLLSALLQYGCAGVIIYTTQQKSEPAKAPRQDPNAAATSGIQPDVH